MKNIKETVRHIFLHGKGKFNPFAYKDTSIVAGDGGTLKRWVGSTRLASVFATVLLTAFCVGFSGFAQAQALAPLYGISLASIIQSVLSAVGGAGLVIWVLIRRIDGVKNEVLVMKEELKEDVQGVKNDLQGVKDDVKNDLHVVKDDVQGVKDELKEDVQGVKDELKEDVQGVKDDLKDDVQGVKDGVQGVKDELKEDVQDVKDIIVKNERQNQGEHHRLELTIYRVLWYLEGSQGGPVPKLPNKAENQEKDTKQDS